MWKREKYKQKLHNYHALVMALRKSELNENMCCYEKCCFVKFTISQKNKNHMLAVSDQTLNKTN